ncbi:hypothetical protein [Sulfurisphaera ohwakuensis]|uniref:Uncharacterized protein n=1 Tax=Sulfurisphaera ohwakuensis TaxID=69656 RepID=A0A650CJD0_SULOH|nr:hypothetical protein [Sulfurisphaera ohwakuensis]MBB5253998.1 hypothetical protein [Sulfurisphaera ohwakuensis]QGR17879.1 hypothetical protein D1869_12370 [Sulfurisphaera ohwakuensis]
MSELAVSLRKMKSKGDKESVLQFLREIMKLIPPSDDFGISLSKKGVHEYVLDRNGVVVISLSEDEFLPFFSANHKRIELDKIPDDVLRDIKVNWKNILDQLRDYALEYSKLDKKYLKVADEINGVLFENL